LLDKYLGMTKVKIKIEVDKDRLRPSDVQILWGDNTKFCKQTGWKPEIPFDQTIKDIFEYWKERLVNKRDRCAQ